MMASAGGHWPSDPSSSHPGSLVLRLPPELTSQIMASVDSMRDLRSLAHAHRTLASVFREHAHYILRVFLAQQIPHVLLPFAIATHTVVRDYGDLWEWKQDCDRAYNWYIIERRLHDAFSESSQPSPVMLFSALTPQDLLAIAKTHEIVDYFTNDYSSQALPLFKQCFADSEIGSRDDTCTEAERYRLYRAFYRFEFISRTFGAHGLDYFGPFFEHPEFSDGRMALEAMQMISRLFFWSWSPWANEQYASVSEYLQKKLEVAIEDVAAHDVYWGYLKVDWITPRLLDSFIRGGLPLLHKISLASDYDNRKRAIDLKRFPICGANRPRERLLLSEYLPYQIDCMPASVLRKNPGLLRKPTSYDKRLLEMLAHGIPWADVDGDDSDTGCVSVDARILSAVWKGIDDVDTLPVELWRCAHDTTRSSRLVGDPDNIGLRNAGYVFWDGPKAGTQMMLECTLDSYRDICLIQDIGRYNGDEYIDMMSSWVARRRIFLKGGTGYWSPGDESRVSYD